MVYKAPMMLRKSELISLWEGRSVYSLDLERAYNGAPLEDKIIHSVYYFSYRIIQFDSCTSIIFNNR